MRNMKNIILPVFLFVIINLSQAQQLPYFTQFKTNSVMLNPAVTGTKRLLDIRMNYRNQWVGYDANPKTQGFDINSRFMKGTMGAGLSLYKDQTGYTTRSIYAATYAYHIHYPDVELSMGLGANMIKYSIDGSKITSRESFDQAINTAVMARTKAFDANAGILLYNDRFHFGLGVLDLLSSREKFFKGDTVKKISLAMIPHTYVTVGYNWSGDPRFVWENSIQVNLTSAAPIQLAYNLLIHYKNQITAGTSIRLHDAIALHIGYTFRDDLYVAYSYDIGINGLKTYHTNTHEIMLVYSTNLPRYFGKKGSVKEFQRQKFAYMF